MKLENMRQMKKEELRIKRYNEIKDKVLFPKRKKKYN